MGIAIFPHMKAALHTVMACGIAFLGMISVCAGEDEKPGLLKRLFCSLSWKETVSVVQSPRDASCAVTQHIKYKPDINDELTKPEEAWERGYGDCEDIAHAIVELCHMNGFDAWVEVFYSPYSFNAHAVAMGTINGQLWIANGRFLEVEHMNEAREAVASAMRWKKDGVSSKPWSAMGIKYNVAGKPGPAESVQNSVQLASVNP